MGSIVGGWLTGVIVTVNDRAMLTGAGEGAGNKFTPPLAVPPLSVTKTSIVPVPKALAFGVKVSVPVVLPGV